MKKPDDIPEDVWDTAFNAMVDSDYLSLCDLEDVARAILADRAIRPPTGIEVTQLQLALVSWVNVAEMLADQPGMEAHFHDVADATLDVVTAARAALTSTEGEAPDGR
jgi:hypothetical protein